MSKNKIYIIFLLSVSFIFVAVIITSMIDKSRSQGKTDIRTRASSNSYVRFTGVVESYDVANKTIQVSNLRFDESEAKSLGTWTVTVPDAYNYSKYPANTAIKIDALPNTFQIGSHTLTASEIFK